MICSLSIPGWRHGRADTPLKLALGGDTGGLHDVYCYPRLAELVARHRLRERIEIAVERLITALDALDGDPDLEDSDDAEAVNKDGDVLDAGEFEVSPLETAGDAI